MLFSKKNNGNRFFDSCGMAGAGSGANGGLFIGVLSSGILYLLLKENSIIQKSFLLKLCCSLPLINTTVGALLGYNKGYDIGIDTLENYSMVRNISYSFTPGIEFKEAFSMFLAGFLTAPFVSVVLYNFNHKINSMNHALATNQSRSR